MSFVDLVQGATINLFLLLGFVSLFSMVRGFLTDRSKGVPTVVEGLLFGTMAVVAMMVPSSTAPGIIFDCRAGVIGAGALLGGPLCALAILPLPLLYRFHLGGLGSCPRSSGNYPAGYPGRCLPFVLPGESSQPHATIGCALQSDHRGQLKYPDHHLHLVVHAAHRVAAGHRQQNGRHADGACLNCSVYRSSRS